MRTFIISALSALSLAASLNAVSINAANAQAPSCFQGDTMDRDGGVTGALGAPKCDAYAIYSGDDYAAASRAGSQSPAQHGNATFYSGH
jgi:hypothetical protein